MISVVPAPEPEAFDRTVRRPGLLAIAEMVGKAPPHRRTAGRRFTKIANKEGDIPPAKFPAYWTEVLPDLMAAYSEVCAYACFRIHPVTGAVSADHFAPRSRHWRQVYEWSNYRLSRSRLNGRKREFGDVLDPFLVQKNWFVLELIGFQVLPNRALPKATKATIQATIDRLGLDDFKDQCAEDAERYWRRDYSLDVLKKESPFVAFELHRQGRLNAGDAW